MCLVMNFESNCLLGYCTKLSCRNIPEDIYLHTHHRQNVKSYMNFENCKAD